MAKRVTAPLLAEKIESRLAKIGIIGLGYVGLPLAVEFARAGFTVTGIDNNPERVDELNQGLSFTSDVAQDDLAAIVGEGTFKAVTTIDDEIDIFIVCVPTPLGPNREPDLTPVEAATRTILPHLRPGQLVVLESTSYPGTTEEIVVPILAQSGLKAGVDYYLGYSPERIDPGNRRYGLSNTPKVVAGLTPTCLQLAKMAYGRVIKTTVPVSSIKAAEMTKLLENIFRTVNIALVNELTMLADRLDLNIWEIIEAASTKPFGFMRFLPGPGLGGHCLPVDPFYLAWKAKELGFYAEFIELAGKTNEAMPRYVLQKLMDALNTQQKSVSGAKILVIGVAYKNDVGDMRESPAFKIIPLLHEREALIEYHDPFVPSIELQGREYLSAPVTAERLRATDCVLILTAHSNVDYKLIAENAALVVDTRNVMAGFDGRNIVRL